MKRFFSAVCLCLALLVSGFFLLSPSTGAQDNVLENLLNLPAPPPVNPFFAGRANRAENFYSKKNPPPDDAPIEDLLDYWKTQSGNYRELGYNIKPSGKSLERILDEIEKNPESLVEFLRALPDDADVAERIKRLYDSQSSNRDFEEGWSEEVKNWLTYHSKYFSAELAQGAAQAGDTGEYVSNQVEILALARVDWDKAEPILNRLYNDSSQPVSRVLARWGFYRHALDTDSFGDIERYRDELKAIVEDKNATDGMRDLAFDALVKEKSFSGLDDWYFSLLDDETLADLRVNGQSYTGLTTAMYYTPPEKYAEKMIELLKSDNKTVRNAAVRNLTIILNEKNPDVIRALLPWLEDADWAKEVSAERQIIVSALQSISMPESVSGLIAALNEKRTRQVPFSNTAMSNVYQGNSATSSNTTANSNTATRTIEIYPLRSGAISALEKQRDARAGNALRSILPQVDEYERSNVVRAALASNGFSVQEQIDAFETVAKAQVKAESMSANAAKSSNLAAANAMVMSNSSKREIPMPVLRDEPVFINGNFTGYQPRPYDPNEIKIMLGNQIISNTEPGGEFVTALIERVENLEGKEPQTAAFMRRVMTGWRGAAINSLMLRDLKRGRADIGEIVRLLAARRELREKQASEIYEARNGASAFVSGIAACLLEDQNEYDAILSGENAESKSAMLGCARVIRAALPLETVAQNLKGTNKTLARAAENYLEAEDSPTARSIVLSLHPNEAKILGAKTYFGSGEFSGDQYLAELFASVNSAFLPQNLDMPFDTYTEGFQYINETEKRLQAEVKENGQLLGVYAFDKNFIRIYKDKAVFSWEENSARYRERDLEAEEFDRVKNYLAAQKVDELAPFLAYSDEENTDKELLMLGRQGGRRVFVRAERMPPFFAELSAMFEEMRKPPAKLRYELEKDVAGLEILFADDVLQAQTVWKNGDDFRILIDDTARRKRIDKEIEKQEEADEEGDDIDYVKLEEIRRKRRLAREYENYSWHKMASGKLADFVAQPAQVEFVPARDNSAAQAQPGAWKARTANFEIRAGEDGLYKSSGGSLAKIRSGVYEKPVVTPNGRWAIVKKFNEDEMTELVRVNLLTNKEYKIKFQEFPTAEAVAFVPSTNKVLILAGYYLEEGEAGSFYLLDAETGVLQEASGDIRPIIQQTFRPLQPSGVAGEFWAAIPDSEENATEVGIYNEKTMSFKSVMKIPKIQFDSMNMWIDAGKIYFVFEGQLLSLPLPKTR